MLFAHNLHIGKFLLVFSKMWPKDRMGRTVNYAGFIAHHRFKDNYILPSPFHVDQRLRFSTNKTVNILKLFQNPFARKYENPIPQCQE